MQLGITETQTCYACFLLSSKVWIFLENSELRETQTERGNSRGSATEKRTS